MPASQSDCEMLSFKNRRVEIDKTHRIGVCVGMDGGGSVFQGGRGRNREIYKRMGETGR